MDRNEFLSALDRALAGLAPDQERADILRYYEEYFDEAGPEGEAAIIEELGDPEKLAQRLAAEGGYSAPGQAGEAPGGAAPAGAAPGPEPRKGRGGLAAAVIVGAVVVILLLAAVAGAAAYGLLRSHGEVGENSAWPQVSSELVSADPGVSSAIPEQSAAVTPATDSGDNWCSLSGETFTKVDVEAGIADVSVSVGEDYSVYLKWDSGSYSLGYTIRQGELKVTSTRGGHEATVNAWVTITVPQGAALRELDVTTGVGDVWVEDVSATKLDCETGVGAVLLTNVSATELDCETGVGDVFLTDVTANEAEARTGTGDVTWEGALCRETELETGMGGINVTAPGQAADWRYELSSGAGRVMVDGADMGRTARQQSGPSGRLEASSGMGVVTVDFTG